MVLTLIGLTVLFTITFLAFRTAKDTGRSPIKWALIAFGFGFAAQFVLPFLIGFILAITFIQSGTPPEKVGERIPGVTIAVTSMILNLVGGIFLLRFVSNVSDEESFVQPPEPPQF